MIRPLTLSVVSAFLAGCAAAGPHSAMPQAANQISPDSVSGRKIAAFAHCPGTPSGSGILDDGDFRRAPDFGTGYQRYWAGQRFAPGWQVTERSVDLNGSVLWPAPNRVGKIDLDGNTVGAIEHTAFSTTPHASYAVTFLFSGNGGGPPTIKTMKVDAAGQSDILTWDTSNGNDAQHGKYSTETWNFTAAASRTKLRFASQDVKNPGYGPVVAAISVTQY